jgi:hypothetical protein
MCRSEAPFSRRPRHPWDAGPLVFPPTNHRLLGIDRRLFFSDLSRRVLGEPDLQRPVHNVIDPSQALKALKWLGGTRKRQTCLATLRGNGDVLRVTFRGGPESLS